MNVLLCIALALLITVINGDSGHYYGSNSAESSEEWSVADRSASSSDERSGESFADENGDGNEACASSGWSWSTLAADGAHHEPGDVRSVRLCSDPVDTNTLYFGHAPHRPCISARGVVASAVLKNAVNQTGWSYLDVRTNANYSNKLVAYAAGLAEAAVSFDLIGWHMNNVGFKECDAPTDPQMKQFCVKLRKFIDENGRYMVHMAETHKTDPYWQHVKLVLYQLTGLDDAYTALKYADRYSLKLMETFQFRPRIRTDTAMLWMQLAGGDLEDLEKALGKPEHLWRRPVGFGHCSALIKPTANNGELLMSHNSWFTYDSMLRVVKRVAMAFVSNGAVNPGHTVSFSSWPGKLASFDDFYTTSAKLVVSETTINNYNTQLWRHTTPHTLFTWLRAVVANRLAANAQQWVQLFRLHNSGTYNNQWMVVDYKKFKRNQPLPDSGLFWILEQMPGTTVQRDMSKTLTTQGYWPSYNVPYFKQIFNMSKTGDKVSQYGDWFTYDKTPRALIFKRDAVNVNDMKSLAKLMRYNDFKHDPLSRCERCSPPYDAMNAIADRSDLNMANGTYPFKALTFRDIGAIDMKAVNSSMVDSYSMLAVSGPTCDQQPVFQWSKVDFGKPTPHAAQPDKWNFPFVLVDWHSNSQ